MNPLEQLSLEELRRRTSVKWTEHPPDVLPLWVAEMDVDLAPPVREALERVVRAGDTGYPGTPDGPSYAEALAGFAERRWGWDGVDPVRTSLVADVMTGVVHALDLVSDPGDAVVINPPVYPPFAGFLEAARRRIVTSPLVGGRLDLDGLAETFARERPAAYLLCSPHNPTGTVHTREELSRVAALAEEHRVRVVVDEIHAPLVLEGARFTPYLSVSGSGLSLMSASKAFNLAGAKAAVLVAGEGAADDLARLPWVVSHGPSHLGVVAQTAAYLGGDEWLDALLAGLAANRVLLGELLEHHLPDVTWTPPEATYLAWLDCSHLGPDPAEAFLARGRVALNDGAAFGAGGEGRVRLNFATSRPILREALERMAAVRAR